MREFIKDYPIFSYISVPIILVILVVLLFITLKPRSVVKDHFSRLYHKVLEAIEFISKDEKSFSRDDLKYLGGLIKKIKSSYEMLESEELYEVESIITNIERADSIVCALIRAGSTELEIADFLAEIGGELNKIRKALYSFNLSRDDESPGSFSLASHLGGKKSKQKAKDYLKSVKKEN